MSGSLGIFGIWIDVIFDAVADVVFLTIATEPFPTLRIVAQELSETTAAAARQKIARGGVFMDTAGE